MPIVAPGFVIAAAGLAAEARIAGRSEGVRAVAAGGDEKRLSLLLEQALDEGARGIISFGIAGGLLRGLPSGAIVVGTRVVADSRWYPADEAWTKRIATFVPGCEQGTVAGSAEAVATCAEKFTLYKATGAYAADMESHVVARIAIRRGIPFAVLRVVADPAEQRLPPAAVNGLKPDGTPNIIAVLKSLACEPGQLPDLIRTAGATRRAMAGLLRCHRLLGPGLGFADFG